MFKSTKTHIYDVATTEPRWLWTKYLSFLIALKLPKMQRLEK